MSLQEINQAIIDLSSADSAKSTRWFEEFGADAWDRGLEANVKAGTLDKLGAEANGELKASMCVPP